MPVKVSGWGKGSFSNQNIGDVGEVGGVKSAYLKLSFIKEREGEMGRERERGNTLNKGEYLKQRWLPAFPNKTKTHKTLKKKKKKNYFNRTLRSIKQVFGVSPLFSVV